MEGDTMPKKARSALSLISLRVILSTAAILAMAPGAVSSSASGAYRCRTSCRPERW
jgi:hypothetical protein